MAREDLQDVSFLVVPELSEYISIKPSSLPYVPGKTIQSIEIVSKVPPDVSEQVLDGVIQIRAKITTGKSEKKLNVAKPLPILFSIVEPPDNSFAKLKIYLNEAITQLFSYKTNGYTVTFHGEKDLSGLNPKILFLSIVSDDGETIVFLDELGKPTKAFVADGTTIELLWTDATSFVATVVTADGSLQANVALNTASETQSILGNLELPNADPASLQAILAILTEARPRIEQPSTMASTSSIVNSFKAPQIASLEIGKLIVELSKCSEPLSGAKVTDTVLQGINYPVYPTETSPGRYVAGIVVEPSNFSPAQFQSVCENFVGPALTACEISPVVAPIMLQTGCMALAGVVLTIGTPAASVAVLAACEATFAGYASACKPFENAPSGSEVGLCKSLYQAIDLFDEGAFVDVTATKNGESVSGRGQVPETGDKTVNISLAFEGQPTIDSFFTSPFDPAPGQGYSANAFATCIEDRSLTIRVSGTDGYADSTTCGEGVSECSLGVPGAEGGVIDTLRVRTNDGAASRTIQVVF